MTKVKQLYNQEFIQTKIAELGKKLNELYSGEEVCLICVLKGGVMFATELAKNLNMNLTMEFVKLSSYGSKLKSSGKVDALEITLPDLNNKNVIIAEDIVDTGYTAKFLVDYINDNFHTKSLIFCSLLDKKVKRAVDINPDYYCIEIDDKFIVGYGLDYNGYYRNLPYIGYIEQ